MPSSRQLSCPGCHVPLLFKGPRELPFECPHCGARIGLSWVPLLVGLLVGFVASLVVVQLFGLKASAALLWLPILVFCLYYGLPLAGAWVSPLRVEPGRSTSSSTSYRNTLRFFIVSWFSCILFATAYGFFSGWWAFLLGARGNEIAEVADMFSFPLGLVNRSFVIRPDTGLAEAVGIVTANSYFYALGLTLVFKVVHAFISRSRVTQLGISSSTLNDDDDEF